MIGTVTVDMDGGAPKSASLDIFILSHKILRQTRTLWSPAGNERQLSRVSRPSTPFVDLEPIMAVFKTDQ